MCIFRPDDPDEQHHQVLKDQLIIF